MKSITLLMMIVLTAPALAESYQGNPVSSMVRVSYPWGSTTFAPGPEAREMLKDAQYASIVYVSGRTSTQIPSAADEALAFARAASARKYLIDHGVSALKIMVNYVSADDFITENQTAEGKRTNQRVDIEMVFVQMF